MYIHAPDDYQVTTTGYLTRAEKLRETDTLQNLFYAAFEVRCALERTLVDFLVLVLNPKKPDLYLRRSDYQPKVVLRMIRRVDPDFEKRLRFTRLLLQANGLTRSNVPFDFEWVCSSWDRINTYLHHQKDPDSTVSNPEWVGQFETCVDTVRTKLLAMWKSNRGYLKEPNSKGDQVYELFLTGEYTDQQIINMLRLSDIPGATGL
ncbi:MAG: hypothetical protein AB1792_07465 [Candidatus Zixiibacteriota bacterium]